MKNSPPIEKMIKFIKDNGLNNKLIANYLGITQSTFSDKINRIRYGKFTQLQVEKIWEYVQNLEKSISDLKKGE